MAFYTNKDGLITTTGSNYIHNGVGKLIWTNNDARVIIEIEDLDLPFRTYSSDVFEIAPDSWIEMTSTATKTAAAPGTEWGPNVHTTVDGTDTAVNFERGMGLARITLRRADQPGNDVFHLDLTKIGSWPLIVEPSGDDERDTIRFETLDNAFTAHS